MILRQNLNTPNGNVSEMEVFRLLAVGASFVSVAAICFSVATMLVFAGLFIKDGIVWMTGALKKKFCTTTRTHISQRHASTSSTKIVGRHASSVE